MAEVVKHSPLPWRESRNEEPGLLIDQNGQLVNVKASLPFLLTAVNSHDRLLAACKGIISAGELYGADSREYFEARADVIYAIAEAGRA